MKNLHFTHDPPGRALECQRRFRHVTNVSGGNALSDVKYFVGLPAAASMKPFRWRIVLSTVNVAAAIMLSALGAR